MLNIVLPNVSFTVYVPVPNGPNLLALPADIFLVTDAAVNLLTDVDCISKLYLSKICIVPVPVIGPDVVIDIVPFPGTTFGVIVTLLAEFGCTTKDTELLLNAPQESVAFTLKI